MSKVSKIEMRIQFAIRNFYEKNYEDPGKRIKDLVIHDISFKENEKGLNITIQLERPGLLIGHHGKNIDALRKFFEKEFEKEVQLNCEEKTFSFLNFYDLGDIY
jgi:ribosomal protein S3